jgi:thioredoxin 1
MANEHVTEVNDSNFESVVLQSELPVLVDFWAPWCGPCRMIGPVVEEIATERAGKARVCKINVDEAGATAARFGINAIPALFVFKNGEVVAKSVGMTSKNDLLSKLDAAS